jgi:hypothetical protein
VGAEEVEAALDPADEGLVGMLLQPRALARNAARAGKSEVTKRRRRPQPNKRDEPRPAAVGERRSRQRPCGTSPHPQSSEQVFRHGETGRATEGHGERQYGASREARSNTVRSAILSFSVVLRGPRCFSVLKNLLACLWDRYPGPVSNVSRLADAKRHVSREAPALGAVLAEAAPNQCVIGILAEIRRGPR